MSPDVLADLFRAHSGKAIATLIRLSGDIQIAEEAVQDAFLRAIEHWPHQGIPPNPVGWIFTTARNRILDHLRRENYRKNYPQQHNTLTDTENTGILQDDLLRLLFTCCHPALSQTAQVALSLSLLGGLQTPEIAHAFLVPEATIAQRLVRAKRKIREARIPYRIPDTTELPQRLPALLAVIYLIFNEGYNTTTGPQFARPDLCQEAIRLCRILVEWQAEQVETAEAHGLLALMLLIESRRPARHGPDDTWILLPQQNRRLWDQRLIAEGQTLLRRCIHWNQPGPYQYQAAIQAVHADAAQASATDWPQILRIYDQLYAGTPTAIIALNRAIALAEVYGPQEGLTAIADLPLEKYPFFHATQADFLSRLDQKEAAIAAYTQAIALSNNPAQRHLLEQKQHILRGNR